MSSYYKSISVLLIVLFAAGCATTSNQPAMNANLIKRNFEYKEFSNEDRYVMFALEYLKEGQTEDASYLFEKLYENTFKEEYLLEYVKLSYSLKRYDDVIKLIDENKAKIEKDNESIMKIYALSLLQKNDYARAEVEIKKLLKKNRSNSNYEILANVYIKKTEYEKAKEIYENLYDKTSSVSSIVNLSNLMFRFTNQKDEAINLLETYVAKNGCEDIVCSKLLNFYEKEKNIDGVISILKKTYYNFEKEGKLQTAEKVYKLLTYYLEKLGPTRLIAFLEESGSNDEKLLSLYRSEGFYEKAFELANKLYHQTSNIDYLGQIAIIEFEMAKDKRKVLTSVIKKFKDVLTVLDNHVYQNYLGYILIDFDVDVKKGVFFVKKALEKAPNNLAYIDSLAWGQYKLNDCQEAYTNMKKVVDTIGLSEEEIKTHWEKIKECSK